jgi:hypothetical protein
MPLNDFNLHQSILNSDKKEPLTFQIEKAKVKNNKHVKVKMLFGSTILAPAFFLDSNAEELKCLLCKSTALKSSELIILNGAGKELTDDDKIHESNQLYAVVRSNASSMIDVKVILRDGSKKYEYAARFSAGIKIFQLKRDLQKMTKIPTTALRAIIASRLIRDEYILGDYILAAASRSGQAENMKGVFTIFVQRSFDATKEAAVMVLLPNGHKFNTFLAVGERLIKMRDILWHQLRMPRDLRVFFATKVNERYVPIDESKSLVDYGSSVRSS